ncbi:TIGR04283 family arsenosugar biosynthesis glycosyltransferase [Sedimentitalea sp. XS_ASV28]|uniref:TIGR04283 family arsenosugar biosynthesis glycosyltransferase n=1 Tax=Sedimentitalea sp. XS_ASV28 TaxID=3241296 RepID=UPI0035168B7A
MPAEISIVIPTLNAQAHLPGCLAALMEGLSAGLIRELIVSDGGSTDATCRIADEAGAVLIRGPASRGGQLRRGIEKARGRWLLVLHADTRLEPGWAAVVDAHLAAGQGQSAYFRLAFCERGVMPAWVAGWANLRSRLFGLPYGDQGLLMQRAVHDRAGGYPDQPLMEDVALVRALPRPLIALPVRAFTSAERYREAGWLRRGARNLWTLARYFAGADPERLAASYRR